MICINSLILQKGSTLNDSGYITSWYVRFRPLIDGLLDINRSSNKMKNQNITICNRNKQVETEVKDIYPNTNIHDCSLSILYLVYLESSVRYTLHSDF